MWEGFELDSVQRVCVDEELLKRNEVDDGKLTFQELETLVEITTCDI